MSTPDTAVQNALNLARKKKFPAARRLLFDAMENPALALRAQELLVAMLAKGNGRAAREAPSGDHLNRAVALFNKLHHRASGQLFKEYLSFWPLNETALWHLALSYHRQHHFDIAVRCLDLALAVTPRNLVLHKQKAMTLGKGGLWEQGIQILDDLAKTHPGDPDLDHARAEILKEAGQLETAVQAYESAIARNPKALNSSRSLAKLLMNMGEADKAEKTLKTAAKAVPGNSDVMTNLGLIQLLNREFEAGWQNYNHRFGGLMIDYFTSRHPHMRNVSPDRFSKLWDGKSKCKKLLIWPDQGIGDEVMFATILQHFKPDFPVTVQLDNRLLDLFQSSLPNFDFKSSQASLDFADFSHHLPLGQLSSLLLNDLSKFHRIGRPFIAADPAGIDHFTKKYRRDRPLVGISWRSANLERGKLKSIPLDILMQRLAQVPCDFVNLQYGEFADECDAAARLTGAQIHHIPELDKKNDINGLAGAISACDHIISISNATIHFAGALGKSASLILPKSCEWRWGRTEQTSIWYDSVTIFRQTKLGSWDDALQIMADDLKHRIQANAG